jgi:hypothetical protein
MSSKTVKAIETIGSVNIPWGSTWRHYKGGVYVVDYIGIDTTAGDAVVIYHRIDGPDYNHSIEQDLIFSRPVSEWFDDVVVRELNDEDLTVKRFVKVRRVEVWQEIE